MKVRIMFTLLAGLVFSLSFLFALGVIVLMFDAYRDRIAAALLFEPMPREPVAYRIVIRRPRVAARRRVHAPARSVAFAA